MPIHSIRINNFKSLRKIFLNLNNGNYDIHCLLGRNGSGKSSLLDALKYFYDNLAKYSISENIIDNSNPYVQRMEISLTYELSDLMIKNTNHYIREALNYLNKYINGKNQIFIKLVQYKDNTIQWYPNDKKLLKIVHRLFPIYLIDTRFINLQDWSIIWEIMSDLAQTTLKLKNNELDIAFDTAFEKIYGDKYLKTLKIIEKAFKQENIITNQYDYTMRFKSSLISRLGSAEFMQSGNKLGYYSDGLNSFNFLKLLLYLVPALADTGWKNPMLIVDEPEIGLHPQYIDKLVSAIGESAGRGVNILISTHSPSLVSELIKRETQSAMFRVSLDKGYTNIEKMNEIIDEIDKPILTINESSCYFSNAVVFVEGASEMQLLTHKRIKEVFPVLGKVHIYPYDSNNTKLRFINPDIINFNIPYLVLVDMDKILEFKYLRGNCTSEGYINIRKDKLVNPLSNGNLYKKELKLYYSSKDYKKHCTYNVRQYIKKMIKTSKFRLVDNLFYIDDEYFERLIQLTTGYCNEYNVFPVKTTGEGLIVTEQAFPKLLSWLYDENKCDLVALNKILDRDIDILGRQDIRYRTTIIRLICNGKLDTFQTLNNVRKSIIPEDIKKSINELGKDIGKKTGGWIIGFMNYYFDKHIKVIEGSQAKREAFKKDFPELFNIIQNIEYMIELM